MRLMLDLKVLTSFLGDDIVKLLGVMKGTKGLILLTGRGPFEQMKSRESCAELINR